MQDGRDDRVGVEMQIRQDLGGRQRMRDVGLTRESLLALVRLGAAFGGRA
jgi:hypothetical protein